MQKQSDHYQNLAAQELLKNKYKGFSNIVNDSTLEKLKEEDIILYNSIMAHGTLLERGEAAFKILKPHLAEKKNSQDAAVRIEENKNKPKSAASVPGTEQSVNPLATYQDKKRWKPEQKFR